MPRFIIEGARKDTAEDCTLAIEAADSGEAERLAGEQGVFVAAVSIAVEHGDSVELHNRAQEKPFTHRTDRAYMQWRTTPAAYDPLGQPDRKPSCPYCTDDLKRDRLPTRRSKFSCPQCGRVVWADPWHRIFPSCYLTERQGIVALFLGKLDSSYSTAGRTEDFWWAVQQKDWLRGKTRLTDDEAVDTLWTLMNYNVTAMHQIIFPPTVITGPWQHNELQELMRKFRAELDQVKEKKRAKPNAGKTEVSCPYCHGSLGRLPQPSRRGSRTCSACNGQIVVDPKQQIFDTSFLTERQGLIADCQIRVSRFVFAKGNIEDFQRKRTEMNLAADTSDAAIARVVRALIEDNFAVAVAKAQTDAASRRAIAGGYFGDVKPDMRLADMVREILNEFDSTWQRFLPDGRLPD